MSMDVGAPSGFSVRRLGPDDAAAIAALHARSFPRPWAEQDFRRILVSDGSLGFGVRADAVDGDCGFVVARQIIDEAEILTLGVLSECRRNGYARALISALSEHAERRGCRKVYLEVAADNAPALALYSSLGFSQIGRRTAYYRRRDAPPGDALVMARGLGAGATMLSEEAPLPKA